MPKKPNSQTVGKDSAEAKRIARVHKFAGPKKPKQKPAAAKPEGEQK